MNIIFDHSILEQQQMTDVRPWAEYQDLILRKLKEEEKIQKWTIVAQKMADQYNLKGRNGKQCKQRYQLLTDDNQQQADWDYQQQQKLFQLHSQLGNKWAIIGQQIMNKSDNQVKNHLYSKLRKALRKLNKMIKQNFKKQFKEIKQNLIYKIIEGAEDKFKNAPLLDQQVSEYCTELKIKLLNYSYDDAGLNPLHDFQDNRQIIRNFLQQLIEFTKDYKRKPKKVRRASGHNFQSLVMENINTLSVPRQEKKIRSNGNSPCHSEVSQQDSEQMAQFNNFALKMPSEIFGIKMSNKSSGSSNKQIKQNIIIRLPANFTLLGNDMQEQNNQSQNGFGGFSNFAPDTKVTQPQNTWNGKGSDSMWNSGKNDSMWKGNNSNEMIEEGDHVENQLKKVGLLQEEEDMYNPPFPTNMKKLHVSKKSSFSNFEIQQEQQHMFYDDSPYNPRIQMTGIEGKKFWLLDSSLEQSDKLFKSNDAYGMFESADSRQSEKLFQSIEKQ